MMHQIINRFLAKNRTGFQIDREVKGAQVRTYILAASTAPDVARLKKLVPNLRARLATPPIRLVEDARIRLEVPCGLTSFPLFPIGAPMKKYDFLVGRDTLGQPVVRNLESVPHMLLAGTTGSGKSVAINSMIGSLAASTSPHNVQFVLMDPKQVEFSGWQNLPHVSKVLTKPFEMDHTLESFVNLMHLRYGLMRRDGERSWKGDKWVIVLDEFASLVAECHSVLENVSQLAAKARAAGIHLWLTTQNPTAKTLGSDLKSNMPGRLAFRVPAYQTSRVILDEVGAERLLGLGDGLFRDQSGMVRIQAPLFQDSDIGRLMFRWQNSLRLGS